MQSAQLQLCLGLQAPPTSVQAGEQGLHLGSDSCAGESPGLQRNHLTDALPSEVSEHL